ncbi:MAG TPA: hypothetical protein ENN34_11795 [Deltaproteobacteria bacterium]|nr:hypothetical protein [Deltaproteobacteria bacterium]
MKHRHSLPWYLAVLCLIVMFGCGGSSGGGDDDIDDDQGGGSGTIGGMTVFWQSYTPQEKAWGALNSVRQTTDNGFIGTGWIRLDGENFEDPMDLYLVKADSSGTMVWVKSHGTTNAWEMGNCVLQTSDGGYIAGGVRYREENNIATSDFYLLRTDAEGNALTDDDWPKTYSGAHPTGTGNFLGYVGILDICEVSDGFVFVGKNAPYTYIMKKVARDGTELWERTYSGAINPARDAALSLDPTGDGGFTVAGVDTGPQGALVGAFRTDANGNIKQGWPRTYGRGTAFSVKNTPDGGFVLAGKTLDIWSHENPKVADALIVKVDAQGNESWRKTFGDQRNDEFSSVDVYADGTIIAVGVTESYSPGYDSTEPWCYQDVFMVKLDGSGNTLWQKVLGRTPCSEEFAKSVQALSDGGFVIGGGGAPVMAKMSMNGNTVSLGENEFKYSIPDTQGIITPANAMLIAERGAGSLLLLRELGSFGLDLLLNILVDPDYQYCTTSGDSLITPTPGAVTAGDYTVTLTNCVTGSDDDEVEFDGTFDMNVDIIEGTLAIDGSYTVNLTYSPIDLGFADDVGHTAIDGALAFWRQASGNNLTERVTVSPSNPLLIDKDSVLQTITSCSLGITVAGSFALGVEDEIVVFELEGIDGFLTLTVIAQVVGSYPESPTSGELLIEAEDGSTVTITVDSGDAVISFDTDGDDISDGTLTRSWDDLY